MGKGYWMGLDAGGGSGRCVVLEHETGAITAARRTWTHAVAPGTGGLGRDLDLEAIWQALADATREALARAGATPERVEGLAVSGMRFAMVVLDAAGGVLYAGPNIDPRAAGPGLRLAMEQGDFLLERTGHWINPIFGLPRLQWLQEQGASLDGALAFGLGDWLTARLSGERVTDPTAATGMGLLDLERRVWATDLLERFALPPGLFAELREPGSRVGGLRADAASALGLAPGTPVAVGGGDTQCGLLGCGAARTGDIGIVAGTTTPVQRVIPAPAVDVQGRVWTEPFLLPDRWVVESNAGPMGDALTAFARILAPESLDPVARLFGEAARSEPGAGGQTSLVGGEVMNAREMALPVASLQLGALGTSGRSDARSDLARSAVESAAFSIRANLEQTRGLAPSDTERIFLGGGLSQSGTLAQLVADVLARPLQVAHSPEATGLGAALCAGVATGAWPDLAAAADHASGLTQQIQPRSPEASVYEGCYSRWNELRQAQESVSAVARGHAMQAMFEGGGDPDPGESVAVRPRILVTASLDAASLESLRALGDVEYANYREAHRLLTGDALVEALQDVDVFVTEIDVVDAASMARARDLRVVASCRGDAVNVDVEAASELGIPVLNAPGRNADAVADLTLAFLLMLSRKLAQANAFLREPGGEAGDMGRMGRAFGALQGRELWQKTIGLVGLGAVGRGVAKRLSGFGAHLLACDPFVTAEQAALDDVELVDLETLLARSDFVSLHAPVSDATRGLMGSEELARMKPGACLVNTARAALVDEEALVAALQAEQLAGAALDVFAVEPPGSDHPLLAFDAVVATPHVGGNTAEVAAHQGRIIGDDLARMLAGQAPRNALNPQVAEGFRWSVPRPKLDTARIAALRERPPPAVTDLQRDQDAKPRPSSEPEIADADVPAEVLASMTVILRGFCQGIESDAAMRAHAEGRNVTLAFTLSDLSLRFFVRLRDGAVRAELGVPEGDAEVNLKLAAEVFDGMFTGTANPMEAAMDGRLSFSGDTAKAMTLQELQGDLSRLYRAVREEVGGPGDLGAIGEPPRPASAPAVAVASAPGRNRVGDVRDELCDVIDELFAQQVITATGGNVSVRVPGEEALWITPSQLFKGDLDPEVLVRIDLEGQSLDESARAASSERLMHCAVYRNRPEANAVIHAHAPHATILANAELPFLPVSTEAAFFGEIPRVPFVMPGTQALADAIGEAARDSWAVLMVNHGLLVGGRSLRRAADMVEIVERSCEIILGCLQVGKQPPVLPDDIVEKLRKVGDLIA